MAETSQQYHDRRDSNQKLAYERKVVRKLLKASGVTAMELRVKEPDAGTSNADYYLSIGWLHDEYPDVPIRLMAHGVGSPKIDTLCRPWVRKGIWASWSNVEEALGGERDRGSPIGCAFTLPPLGDVLLHDMVFPSLYTEDMRKGAVIIPWVLDDGNTVFLETLDSFSIRLGNLWRP